MVALKAYIEGSLTQSFIQYSTSPLGAPLFFVKKEDGGLRLCTGYQGCSICTQAKTPM